MDSNTKAYAKVLQETFPNFSKIDIKNVAHTVKQKLEKETLFNRFFYHIEAARKEGGNHNRLRELVMIFIEKCMVNGFEPYSLDLPEALDDRTLFLANIIYEAYKTHWITPSRTEEAVKLESEAIEDFDREAWNILKTLGEIDRPYFQKIKNSKFSSGVEIITTKESYIRYILSKSWYGQTYTVDDCVKSASEWGLTPDDVPQIVAELNSRRAALDTRDKAWGRMQNHTKPLITKTCANKTTENHTESKSYHQKDGSVFIQHPNGRAALHTKDGAWIDFDFRSPEERLDPYANYLSSSRNVDCAPPPQTFKDKLIDFLIEAWPITILLVIAILVLPLHGISLILDECTRLSDDECLECAGWITAGFWLTVALGFILNKCLKKKGLSYKTLILSSIRALRRLLRRLEESTRP